MASNITKSDLGRGMKVLFTTFITMYGVRFLLNAFAATNSILALGIDYYYIMTVGILIYSLSNIACGIPLIYIRDWDFRTAKIWLWGWIICNLLMAWFAVEMLIGDWDGSLYYLQYFLYIIYLTFLLSTFNIALIFTTRFNIGIKIAMVALIPWNYIICYYNPFTYDSGIQYSITAVLQLGLLVWMYCCASRREITA